MKVKDLAEKLNLSPATVSLVLNDRPGISDKTREKVKRAVVELGCEDMLTVREKERKKLLFVVYRKNMVGDDNTHYFSQLFSKIIEGVEYQAKNRDFQLMITYADEKSLQDELVRIHEIKADGILLLATEMKERQLDEFLELEIPLVVIDNYIEKKGCDCVTINNEMGVYEAVSYLAALGHKRIGYLHIVQNANNFKERYYGFLSAIEKLGIPLDRKFILQFDTNGGDSLPGELTRRLAELKDMPTAFFADNDITAICAIQSLKKLGYKIPEDISVIGFDNMPLSELLEPPLTTIQAQKRKMGTAAVNLLVDKMEEEAAGNLKMEVSTSLIVRQSARRPE